VASPGRQSNESEDPVSDPTQSPGQPESEQAEGTAIEAVPRERVALGLLAALVAVAVGVVLTVVIWRAGYIASITSLAIAIGAVYLYSLAAGSPPRKGLAPVILIVLLGVVLSFFAVVASDLLDAYDKLGLTASGVSQSDFVRDNIFNAELLKEYGQDMVMFAVFAALGVFGTMRRLVAQA
jgi:hypothetical protein